MFPVKFYYENQYGVVFEISEDDPLFKLWKKHVLSSQFGKKGRFDIVSLNEDGNGYRLFATKLPLDRLQVVGDNYKSAVVFNQNQLDKEMADMNYPMYSKLIRWEIRESGLTLYRQKIVSGSPTLHVSKIRVN